MAWFSRNGPSGQFHNETIAQPLPNILKKEVQIQELLKLLILTIVSLNTSFAQKKQVPNCKYK